MAKAVGDQDACVGCEACVGVCPTSAISMNDGKAKVDPTHVLSAEPVWRPAL